MCRSIGFYEKHSMLQQPPWLEDIIVTPELIFRYQVNERGIDEVLQADLEALARIHQASSCFVSVFNIVQVFLFNIVKIYAKSLYLDKSLKNVFFVLVQIKTTLSIHISNV